MSGAHGSEPSYTHLMAFNANPVRFMLRSFASAACLIAVLLLTTPCLMAQQPVAPAAMHCSDCCDRTPSLSTSQTCCALQPQPVQHSAFNTYSPGIRTSANLLNPSAPTLSPHHRNILISASTSPPPLHPILRI